MRRDVRDILFTLLLLAAVSLAVWDARQWELKARLFPWAIGFPLMGLLATVLLLQLSGRAAAPKRHLFETGSVEVDPSIARRRALTLVAWLLGFLAIIWVVGFPIGGTLATLAYLRWTARESWRMSLYIAAGTAVFFWLMVTQLNTPFPKGAGVELLESMIGVEF